MRFDFCILRFNFCGLRLDLIGLRLDLIGLRLDLCSLYVKSGSLCFDFCGLCLDLFGLCIKSGCLCINFCGLRLDFFGLRVNLGGLSVHHLLDSQLRAVIILTCFTFHADAFVLAKPEDSIGSFFDILIILCKHSKFLPGGGFKEVCPGIDLTGLVLFRCAFYLC